MGVTDALIQPLFQVIAGKLRSGFKVTLAQTQKPQAGLEHIRVRDHRPHWNFLFQLPPQVRGGVDQIAHKGQASVSAAEGLRRLFDLNFLYECTCRVKM
ncbi:hypothetical protein SAMN02746041_03122 [Desulfacinum hydrothermale DSM 13146]|uniref:Uncharacterized protein n=1 Tax=Desulfacinum hydrothermale DSM 13146 TaxID=1121390 RepID=A0A1W1XVC3_9BACT|nr:hypothetical protein [Desulfacinum hydrothermale]SMC27930.1 hypothetical protein SAMN02746041_03122 [Desulfacinum hydrothermale DSM 13146]